MKIEALGDDKAVVDELVGNIEKAVEELGIDCEIVPVMDEREILLLGVTVTPALVVEEALRVMGRVPDVEEIKTILKNDLRTEL